jgi:hypothetical protein
MKAPLPVQRKCPRRANMENGTKQKKHLASLSLWKNCGQLADVIKRKK